MSNKIEIEYELTIEPEELEPDFGDAETLAWIREQVDAGNEYAWFCAKVTARVEIEGETFEGVDYLGGCSYKSREDFVGEEKGYYADMRSAALDDLKAKLLAAQYRGAISTVALRELEA